MAEIRCPNCGRSNPDILDVCQFCQTPLKPESVLRIGQTPTKKNTGELESVLPDWLKDVRQQARDSAQEEAAQAAAQPAKNEPPDLLAGLASQAGSGEEEEVPDWLASIRSAAKPEPETPSKPAPETDFFAQFNQEQSKPASEPPQEQAPSGMDQTAAQPPVFEEKDELSEWFSQAAEKPEETFEFDSEPRLDAGWGSSFDTPLPPKEKEPAPKEEEDLSWLRNLEEVAKKTGDLKAPKQGPDWRANFETPSTPSQPSTPQPASQDDLSWLDSLGGIEESSQQPFEQPGAPKDDLSWLNQFGETQAPEPFEATEKPSAPKEDLSWLNNLGAAPEPEQLFDAASNKPIPSEDLSWLNNLGGIAEQAQPSAAPEPEAADKPFSKEDLSWLNDLGATSEQPQPFDAAPTIPPQEEPGWLKDLGGEPEPLSTPPFVETGSLKGSAPRQTAPLGEKHDQEETEPDWLKSATEAPSMPAPGDLSMDWFTTKEQPAEEKPSVPATQPPEFSDLVSTPSGPSSLSNQDVDSLFSMEMPDWLSHPEPAADEETPSQTAAPVTDSEGSLAPVELPSWVQAMRPVEAMVSETAPSLEDQAEEKEGPLAGLRGVIPSAPIGSSRRPKAISLTLQASSEQQAGAALLEQILGSETSPRALVTAPFVASQQVLRWALAALFLLVLGAIVFLRSQSMPVSQAPLPAEMQFASDTVANLPDNSRVLVIVDYEPSLAGEMEAVGGPLLTDLVSRHHPTLSFLSTSVTGTGLVERLLNDTTISKPDGFAYQSGTQYFNLGYLPGGSAGVLGFIENPASIIPDAGVGSLSEYSALIVMTDHAESGRVWVEQLQNRKQLDPALSGQPLLVVASAQAGPLLQPYVASRQINGILTGLYDAARYETAKNVPNKIAGSYWDTFGIGLAMSIALIVIGSLWSVFAGIRARRAEAQ